MKYQELFQMLQKQEIRMAYQQAKAPLPLGVSKIGGKPHLPKDFEWPYFEGETYDEIRANRPLAFLMQVNLADVKPYDAEHLLPEHGMLYFFYDLISQRWGFDPSDKGCAEVFYYDIAASDLTETDFPAFPENESDYMSHDFPECTLSFSSAKSLPSYEELGCHCDDNETDWEEYEEAANKFGVDWEFELDGNTKLLGYADLIQGEMLSECESVTRGIYCGGAREISEEEKADIEEKCKEWILLCQIGTIHTDRAEWMWGDCGYLYFYIREKDLQNRNFHDIWMILQCG